MRPMTAIIKCATRFDCDVTISNGPRRANGKSMIEMMGLDAEQGAEVVLEVSGPDAERALVPLAEILAKPEWSDPVPPENG